MEYIEVGGGDMPRLIPARECISCKGTGIGDFNDESGCMDDCVVCGVTGLAPIDPTEDNDRRYDQSKEN